MLIPILLALAATASPSDCEARLQQKLLTDLELDYQTFDQTPDSGFVTILDGEDRVVSNPAGTAPEYRNGELQLMVQEVPVFKHCHDVCVDDEKNLYVCQWNADRSYPIKLHRVA